MITITQNDIMVPAVNPDRLKDELALAGLPEWIVFQRTITPFSLEASWPDGTDPEPIIAVINAHDASQPSAAEFDAQAAQAQKIAAEADLQATFVGLRQLPVWDAFYVAYARKFAEANGVDWTTLPIDDYDDAIAYVTGTAQWGGLDAASRAFFNKHTQAMFGILQILVKNL